MKFAPFDYRAPTSVAEAVDLLAAEGSAVLAGGQSLLVEMRYRRQRPALLVDINRIAELAGYGVDGDELRVGALARHADLERAGFDDPLAGLLRQTARYVSHPPVRALGTFAGSLAWAHPAAEWAALAAALEARVVLRGPAGVREVGAPEWFRGPHLTACGPGELVTEVRLPLLGPGTAVRFAELRRTHASFALVAVAVAVRAVDGRIDDARIGLAGAGAVPRRARGAEDVLRGAETGPGVPAVLGEAAEQAVAEADPVTDDAASAAYRRQVVTVLVRRCLAQALAADGQPGEVDRSPPVASDRGRSAGSGRGRRRAVTIPGAELTLRVNGELRRVEDVEPRTSLADLLRDRLDLTGTNLGCEHGVCGSCTVLLDGTAVRSCLVLALQCAGRSVQTVEGLAGAGSVGGGSVGGGSVGAGSVGGGSVGGDGRHPLQEAFAAEHALQCGFCTPGFLMLLAGALAADPDLDRDETRMGELLASNLCRCTGYAGIRRAARLAAERMRASP